MRNFVRNALLLGTLALPHTIEAHVRSETFADLIYSYMYRSKIGKLDYYFAVNGASYHVEAETDREIRIKRLKNQNEYSSFDTLAPNDPKFRERFSTTQPDLQIRMIGHWLGDDADDSIRIGSGPEIRGQEITDENNTEALIITGQLYRILDPDPEKYNRRLQEHIERNGDLKYIPK